jgi:hypothetical protein
MAVFEWRVSGKRLHGTPAWKIVFAHVSGVSGDIFRIGRV